MCCCDHDPPTFYDAKTVTGRKPHKCVECLRVIEKGERQEYVTGLWEGHFSAFRTCQQCIDLRESMNLDCFVHGHLMDDISCCDELTPEMEAFNRRRDENYLRLAAERRAAKEARDNATVS